MSRSRRKSCTDKGGFWSWAVHSSNKKAKVLTNQKFRSKSKRLLKNAIKSNSYDDMENVYKQREVSNVWDFPSDGLARYHVYDESWTDYDKMRIARK